MIQLIQEIYYNLISLDFWLGLFSTFKGLGPLAAIMLALIESIIPALPLITIATLNVAAYGGLRGFFFTWGGSVIGCTLVFLFFRHVFKRLTDRVGTKKKKVQKARQWVATFDPAALFLILCLPFTPSSFMNFAFGISDYSSKKYLITMMLAKLVMIATLAIFGTSVVEAMENPLILIPGLLFMGVLYVISVVVRRKHGFGKNIKDNTNI